MPEPDKTLDNGADKAPDKTPRFPAPHADGSRWTEDETDAAVEAYLYALDNGDPDAGRMRTVIGMFKHPKKQIGDRVKI